MSVLETQRIQHWCHSFYMSAIWCAHFLVLCENVPPSTAEKFEEGKNFHLHETHFDIIMDVPPTVTVLGSSKNTPVQMCCVADHFLGKNLPF